MDQQDLAQKIERALESVGIYLAAEVRDKWVVLTGEVDSEENVQAARDIASDLASNYTIETDIELMDTLPVDVESFQVERGPAENLPDNASDLARGDSELDQSFTDQPMVTDEVDVVEDMEEPYTPPTDPVIKVVPDTNAEVLGGFAPTAMDDIRVDRSASDGRPGDEALEDAVRQALEIDASTTALNISVLVRNGVAHLRGDVEGIEDADNAESVAGAVPGIVEVVDETRVAATGS